MITVQIVDIVIIISLSIVAGFMFLYRLKKLPGNTQALQERNLFIKPKIALILSLILLADIMLKISEHVDNYW